MDLEGELLDSEGALLHSLPKVGSHGPSGSPVPTFLAIGQVIIVVPLKCYIIILRKSFLKTADYTSIRSGGN